MKTGKDFKEERAELIKELNNAVEEEDYEKAAKLRDEIKERNIPLTLIYGFLFVGISITSALHFEPMMTGFFNPEFGALRTLIELGQTIK